MPADNQEPKERKSLDERHRMSELERLRHSCAHVMATAIARLWPDAQFAAGPPVDTGFYYDVELEHRIAPEDFAAIEAEMKKEIKANHPFERLTVTRAQAVADAQRGRLGALADRPVSSKFKLGNLEDIPEGEEITYYRSGDFVDLCAGPHVLRTGNIGAFKLTSVASAYYKGDERNPQLQRIYGTAFKNKTQLEEWLKLQEEARQRDHRKIGAEMGLYVIDTEFTGPGMPLWLPKGAVIVEELEKLAKETEFAAGYVRVKTPHLAKEKMYRTSGHLPYYAESMFPPMVLAEEGGGRVGEAAQAPVTRSATEGEPPVERADSTSGLRTEPTRYYLKAMNCPHHHRIFAAEPRSYRDLPLRLAEYGCCYRYEQSGELLGLMRVRSLNMNDAHIYCTEDQFAAEFNAVNQMYLQYFKIFGIEKYVMRFSTHGQAGLGKKYVDEPELWLKTEAMVRRVLDQSGINFVEVPDEAAFYGPKIDVQVWSVIGREFTLATNQVDFAVPAKFGLVYRDRDNTDKTPLCIHRAPLGTHERFIGFLIEHYAGNFPLWLAPDQVRVLPVTEAQLDYARGIVNELRGEQVRAELEFSSDKLMGRIQRAEQARVHHILVVGQREQDAQSVAVRIHGRGQQGVQPRAEVVADILAAIRQRRA
ncbi:MAG: threonine--tRNA ligase [Verrucomicrobia bacterium]|nr:threonine--tRNA ligase [Verrucomicrobiota bacterium]